MTLDDTIVSLELGKKLEKAGFPQDTLFSYFKSEGSLGRIEEVIYAEQTHSPWKGSDDMCICAAPTVAEILAVLPQELYRNGFRYYLQVQPLPTGNWDINWTDDIGNYLRIQEQKPISIAEEAGNAFLWQAEFREKTKAKEAKHQPRDAR
jgi:hypothetical protein